MNWARRFLIAGLSCFLMAVVLAEDEQSGGLNKTISIDIQFHGLDGSVNMLNQAVVNLSESLDKVAQSPEDLSPDQFKELSLLMEKTDRLVLSLGSTLKDLELSLQKAKEPATQMVADMLSVARSETIDPTLKSIDDSVSSWVRYFTFGLILIVVLLGCALYAATKQIREMMKLIKSISGEYEIVRRKD